MKARALVFFLLLTLSCVFVFSSAKDDILRTREYVKERLKDPELVFDTQDQAMGAKVKCLNPAVIVLFDPEELFDLITTNFIGDFESLVMLLLTGRCFWDLGKMRVERDVFNYTDKWKGMFGILVSSFEELSMCFSLELGNLRVNNVILYDFVNDWFENGGKLKELGKYLLNFPVGTGHTVYMTPTEGGFSFSLEKGSSLLKNKPYLWMYLVWVELDVQPETPAGMYVGKFALSFHRGLEE